LITLLGRFGATGCFFVNPFSIGLKDYNTIKQFCNTRLSFPAVEFLDWDDLNYLLKEGHEIGSHTMNHINVAKADLDIFSEDLTQSHATLVSHCGHNVINHFAYPYGSFAHFNSEAFQMVFKKGYKSCASAIRGCHIGGQKIERHNLLLRRDHLVLGWKYSHILYFLIENSKNAKFESSLSPFHD